MRASENRLAARTALSKNWAISILVSFIAAILGGSAEGSSTSGGSNTILSQMSDKGYFFQDTIPTNVAVVLFGVLASIAMFLLLYSIVMLILGGAINVGLKQYYISLNLKDQPASLGTLFSKFNIFGKAFLLHLLTNIFVFLWTLLFVIPGIIAMYRYAMAPYIMAQNPDIDAMEALNRSKQMMDGNKWRLFCLHCSFIGWSILAIFTFGIGFLWLSPYVSAAEANFYLRLTNQQI